MTKVFVLQGKQIQWNRKGCLWSINFTVMWSVQCLSFFFLEGWSEPTSEASPTQISNAPVKWVGSIYFQKFMTTLLKRLNLVRFVYLFFFIFKLSNTFLTSNIFLDFICYHTNIHNRIPYVNMHMYGQVYTPTKTYMYKHF